MTAVLGEPLLDIRGLSVSYASRGADGRVLRGVDLQVRAGEIVGIVGETGSGKTTLARAAVGVVGSEEGHVVFDGRDLRALRGRELRAFRRSGEVQYAFQDPLRALDPDLTVRDLVEEPLAVAKVGTTERRARAVEALEHVGLDPAAVLERRPRQLSGGQRQRVLLARAIVTRPRLIFCDEPVSALDASNRNLVLRLLDRLRNDLGVAVVVISHDLSSLAGIADRVAVLYRGHLVEQGPVADVLQRPEHPYTALLTASAPSVEHEQRLRPADLRVVDQHQPWAGFDDNEGCSFAHRCPFADDACRVTPALIDTDDGSGRTVACHHSGTWLGRIADRVGPETTRETTPETTQEHA